MLRIETRLRELQRVMGTMIWLRNIFTSQALKRDLYWKGQLRDSQCQIVSWKQTGLNGNKPKLPNVILEENQ